MSSEDKHKIEAVLFTTGRFMNVQDIATACGIASVGYVKELLHELLNDYTNRDSALTITEHENTYKMNIKKQYGHLTNKLVSTTEFDNPTVKTLAVIAYKNPAIQSDIIKIRGTNAYDHIKLLRDNGLITTEPQGRTRIIKLTTKFYDYFDTAEDKVKEEFERVQHAVKEKYQKLQDAMGVTATPANDPSQAAHEPPRTPETTAPDDDNEQ